MNRSRFTATALSLLLAAAPALAEPGVLREQSERSFDAAGLRMVRVENPRGLIEVRRGAPGQVRLTALKVVRAPDDQRAELARGMSGEAGPQQGVLVVRARYPRGQALRVSFWDVMRGHETPRAEVRIALEVPPGLAVELRSASGDLRTSELDGAQVLVSTSGDIEIVEARGALDVRATSGSIDATRVGSGRLQSVSGDVIVDGVAGPLQVRTTSGGISVRGAADSLRLESVSGDVRVDVAPRGLSASTTSGEVSARRVLGVARVTTSSGDIDLRAARELTRAELSSVSGEIALEVPSGLGASYDLTTSSGELDVGVGLQVKSVTRHALHGTVGDGRARVSLKSSSGDIHVTLSGGN